METQQKALFIIFGGTGDLAKRKLYPSLFKLFEKGFLDANFAVIGTARRPWTDVFYQNVVTESLVNVSDDANKIADFVSHFYYQSHDVTDVAHYITLKKLADKLDEKYQIEGNRMFYLAMSPQFFGTIATHLGSQNLVTKNGFNRLIIEKPFGRDFESAKKLNDEITNTFDEDQIFRIDHYLGKEMIQNIPAIRFGNIITQTLWNNKYIDNIQLTLSESLGVEERGGYYETSGAMRDMFQNHIMQVVSLLTMDMPKEFVASEIRKEKLKALKAIRILKPDEVNKNFVRGQYGANEAGTEKAYREEKQISPDSMIETFIAGRLMIDNDRWAGVPVYVRSGKRLVEKNTEINIVFKNVEKNIFGTSAEHEHLGKDVLTITVEPDERFRLTINTKEIGQGFNTNKTNLDYVNSPETKAKTPEAYEKLILDALDGNAINFAHWNEVAKAWNVADVILETWNNDNDDKTVFPNYLSGSMGPTASDKLLTDDGNYWIYDPKK
ncbi:glucose-6-phosphate dehydrogenase [Dellaglioa sp. P0083]|uniref:glucose-6-phosphate dehydrogenase n=1 Tax=Dellaglioa kimchii TaxID=3344667 RepID=UPI0038D3C526